MRFCHAARKTKLLKADFKLKAQGTLRAFWGYRNGPPNWPCKANFWWPSRSPRWLKSFLDRSLDNGQKLFCFPCRDENCWQHRQHTSGTKQVKLRNQRDMVFSGQSHLKNLLSTFVGGTWSKFGNGIQNCCNRHFFSSNGSDLAWTWPGPLCELHMGRRWGPGHFECLGVFRRVLIRSNILSTFVGGFHQQKWTRWHHQDN